MTARQPTALPSRKRWELHLEGMTAKDLAALKRAVQSLEHPGLAARLTNMVGIAVMADSG
jgi:hypothetical protein